MSNSTFSGPVRSENGFLQQDPETGEWVPISGGGGGGGGTEHLTGDDASTLVQTRDDTYASIPYWNGVDAPAGANPQGRLTLAYVAGYGNNLSYQRMTINEGGQVTANTSPAGAGANGLVYTTVFTTVDSTSTRAEIVLPSDGFLTTSSRLAALYVYTEGQNQNIRVYKDVSTVVSSGTLVAGYMQNAIQWDGAASSFLWSLDSNYWNPGGTLQIAPATTWVGVSTLRVAAVFKANY